MTPSTPAGSVDALGPAVPTKGPNRYRAGVTLEKRISKHLRGEGFFAVESRGSHGIADIVAVREGEVLAVQAKTSGTFSTAEWNALLDAGHDYGMTPLLAFRDGRKLVFWELMCIRSRGSRLLPGDYEVWTA